jgi:heat shock protein HslJ
MKKISTLLVVIYTVINMANSQTVIYYIGPKKVDCMGVAPMQCMQIKKSPDAPYTLFYNEIEGFTHEAGYEYKLKVELIKIENPPADASNIKYKLVEVIEKNKAMMNNTDTKLQAKWILKKILKSTTLSKVVDGKANIVFGADAQISGNNSCNSFFGTYKQMNNTLNFSQMGSTKMYCEGSIETDFMQNLQKVNAYKITKKYLYLYKDSELLMVLMRGK